MCGHPTDWQIMLSVILRVAKIYLKFLNGVKAMPARTDGGKVT